MTYEEYAEIRDEQVALYDARQQAESEELSGELWQQQCALGRRIIEWQRASDLHYLPSEVRDGSHSERRQATQERRDELVATWEAHWQQERGVPGA